MGYRCWHFTSGIAKFMGAKSDEMGYRFCLSIYRCFGFGQRHQAKSGIIMRTGLFPGTFDPVTNGHIDLVGRAVKLVDRLVVGVATNAEKKPLFSLDERVEMVSHEVDRFQEQAEVIVRPMTGLLMHFAEEIGANAIVRGLRAVSDFEYEFQMVGMNQHLNSDIETMFLMADPRHQAIASRLVKEICRLGGNIKPFVSENVATLLENKLKNDT